MEMHSKRLAFLIEKCIKTCNNSFAPKNYFMKITEYTSHQDADEITSRIAEHDEQGNITLEIDFDDNGQQLLKSTNTYDTDNRLITSTQFDEEEQFIEKKQFEYDENGKLILTITDFPDGSISKESQKIEGQSRLIITEDEDGDFEGSVEYLMDENGLTKELIRTNFMNKVDSILVYEYDNKQQVTKVLEQDPKKRFIKAYVFYYDELGNRTIEEEQNKKGKPTSRTVHTYEGTHLISSKAAEGSVYYTYEDDLIVKEEQLSPDGSSDVIIYEYEDAKKTSEKHYSIPQGENTEEMFLVMAKRYLYE